MNDGGDYCDWIWRTLSSRLEGLAPPDQALVLRSLDEALASDQNVIFGAVIPPEAMSKVGSLRPRITAELERLREEGVVPREAKKQTPLWPKPLSRTEQGALLGRLATLPASDDSLGPYQRIAQVGVGGLRAVGFAPGTELLLVVSSTGRGVFDCRDGRRVGRDPQEVELAQYPNAAPGIPPIKRVDVPLMGLDGGRPLPRRSPEGWSLGVLHEAGGVWLCPPGMPVDQPEPGAFVWRHSFEDLRAAGFSENGEGLVFAEPHTLHIHRRS